MIRNILLITIAIIAVITLKIKTILITIFSFLFLINIFSFIRREYWLYKHKLVRLQQMSSVGKVIVPWEIVLNPKCSKIIEVSDVIDFIRKYHKNNIHLKVFYPDEATLINEINSLSKIESLKVVKYKEFEEEGFLFFDTDKKEQLKVIVIEMNPERSLEDLLR